MAAEPVTAAVHIDAAPEEVYEYFVDAQAMVRWMGQRARLDPRPGGEFAVDVNGSEVRGRFVELDPPHRLVVTWGFSGSDVLAPGTSTVEVHLRPEGSGTIVEIVHRDLPADEWAGHERGWRHFVGRLDTAVAAVGAAPGDRAPR
ncbi:MAG TPA: SRPBCC domain-containing protein [Acidimicrobiales bacterium]|nr:SRPBCC domain-containing protein [Acidimicrobiales bacterium]